MYVTLDQPDMDRVFQLPPTTYIGGPERSLPLREIIQRLEVCGILFCFVYKLCMQCIFCLPSVWLHCKWKISSMVIHCLLVYPIKLILHLTDYLVLLIGSCRCMCMFKITISFNTWYRRVTLKIMQQTIYELSSFLNHRSGSRVWSNKL